MYTTLNLIITDVIFAITLSAIIINNNISKLRGIFTSTELRKNLPYIQLKYLWV